jgi:hypothetical protein
MPLGSGAVGDDERSFCPATVRDVACNLQDLRLANRAGVAWSCSHRAGTYQLSDASRPLDGARSDAINTGLRELRRFRSVAPAVTTELLLLRAFAGQKRQPDHGSRRPGSRPMVRYSSGLG